MTFYDYYLIHDYDFSLPEFYISHDKDRQKITDLQYRLLKYYIDHPGISIYKIHKGKEISSARYPKRTIEGVKKLLSLGLIMRTEKEKEYEYEYFCKLSSKGIFYLILNQDRLHWNDVKTLIRNYRDNPIFQFLVYPYIRFETLFKIKDSAFFERLLSFLFDCCKEIINVDSYIKKMYYQKNGYITQPLFIWENIPRIKIDTESLRDFLKVKLHASWVSNADIKKTKTDDAIVVSSGNEQALIKLDKQKKMAILTYRGKQIYDFIVRIDDIIEVDETNIIEVDEILEFNRLVKIPVKEMYWNFFLSYTQLRVQEFIFSLFLYYGVKSPTTEILGSDSRFIDALEKTKFYFDKKYKFFENEGMQ